MNSALPSNPPTQHAEHPGGDIAFQSDENEYEPESTRCQRGNDFVA